MTSSTNGHISLTDLSELILKLADQINFYWNFYVVVNIAILGWILSLNNNPAWPLKTVASAAFLVFLALNITALLRSYIFLQAASLEFKAIAVEFPFKTSDLPDRISRLSFAGYKYKIWITHAIADIGMLSILWSDKLQDTLRISGP